MTIDRWFRTRRVPMPWEAFEALPRHPAYKQEHLEGVTWLTPRDARVRALLRLEDAGLAPRDGGVSIRRLTPDDWEPLSRTFAAAFRGVPPFETLDSEEAGEAVQACLEATRRGRDGALLESACFVAEGHREDESPRGGLLATLVEAGHPGGWDAWLGREASRPHLTWVFAHPFARRRGVASALLGAAVAELRALGHAELAGTVLAGNLPGVLWHWHHGFRPLSNR